MICYFKDTTDCDTKTKAGRCYLNTCIVFGYLRRHFEKVQLLELDLLIVALITDLYGRQTAPIYYHPFFNTSTLVYVRSDLLPEDVVGESRLVIPLALFYTNLSGMEYMLRHYFHYESDVIAIILFYYQINDPRICWFLSDSLLIMETKTGLRLYNIGYFEFNLHEQAFQDLLFYFFQDKLRKHKKEVVEYLSQQP